MMNPQFGSQYQSGYGPGAPPFSGHQAPAPRQPMPAQSVYNGPNIGQRPSGPRGPMGMPPPMKPGMLPQGQPGMPPQNQPGMPPHGQPGMPPQNQPGMLPHGQPGMSSHGQPGMPPQSQPGMLPQNRPTQPGVPPLSQPHQNQYGVGIPAQNGPQNDNFGGPVMGPPRMGPLPTSTQQQMGFGGQQMGSNQIQPPLMMAPPVSTNNQMGMPPSNMAAQPPLQGGQFRGPPPQMVSQMRNMSIDSTGNPPLQSPNSSMPPYSNAGPPLSSGIGPPPSSGIGPPPASTGTCGPPTAPGMGIQAQNFSLPPNAAPPTHTDLSGQAPTQPYMMRQGPPPSSSVASSTYGAAPQMPPQPSMGQPPAPVPGVQFPPPTHTGGYPGSSSQMASGGYPSGTHPNMQPQQPRRLDPDQMPSPIQVIEDDRQHKTGTFVTNLRGQVPPLITTNFVTQDQGNCNPSFVRSTMYNIPCTSDMLKNSHIPFALSITPFAKLHPNEQEPPLVDLGELGPVRCKRCKVYMSPHMQFIDGGRRFQCVFCNAATDVPPEYFAHLDHTGRRVDCYDRPELCLGSYEFVATKDYCKNGKSPNTPAFIFCIDVSYNSVRSGLVQLICSRLKQDILVNLPKEAGAEESEIRVGFLTYAKEIHFYNVKNSLAQPQMLVVSDTEDVFMPLMDGFLVKLSESEAVIDSLLAQIPQMFAESRETETILGPVVQAGLEALINADCAGKLFLFHTSLPIADAPGKLKNRDDRKILGTDKEKTLLTPQINFYTKVGQQCVAAGCSVDMFLFPNSYVDVASISELCRLTGGNMYKYSYFQAENDGQRFINDLKRNVCRPFAFDAILRVRTSTGIRPVDFYGNFYMTNTTDVELSTIDCDQSISVEIKHDDKLDSADGAYIQVAILYTSVGGFRRLRIHNLSLNCCTQFADLFRNCELDTLINFLAKQAIRNTLNSTPKQVRENMANQVAHILACYRKNCASPSSAGQLILPECMKLLPLYTNCVIKNDAIQGGCNVSTDDRSYLILMLNAMNVKATNVFFYPRLLPLHHIDESISDELADDYLPKAVRCSQERLDDHGIYLLENGITMHLWLGHNVSPEWVQMVFGVQSAAQIDIDKCKLMELDNPLSQRIRTIMKLVQNGRSRQMKLIIVRQRDELEPWFNHFLVEDKGSNGFSSYVDFLCHIHKEIRNLLS